MPSRLFEPVAVHGIPKMIGRSVNVATQCRVWVGAIAVDDSLIHRGSVRAASESS
jgi:hypothetical protein